MYKIGQQNQRRTDEVFHFKIASKSLSDNLTVLVYCRHHILHLFGVLSISRENDIIDECDAS